MKHEMNEFLEIPILHATLTLAKYCQKHLKTVLIDWIPLQK